MNLHLVRWFKIFYKRFAIKSNRRVLTTYNPNNPLSFKKWCKAVCDGANPAFMFLSNPLLSEYTMLMDKYHLSYTEIENLLYDEFLELVNYCANISEYQYKKSQQQRK